MTKTETGVGAEYIDRPEAWGEYDFLLGQSSARRARYIERFFRFFVRLYRLRSEMFMAGLFATLSLLSVTIIFACCCSVAFHCRESLFICLAIGKSRPGTPRFSVEVGPTLAAAFFLLWLVRRSFGSQVWETLKRLKMLDFLA